MTADEPSVVDLMANLERSLAAAREDDPPKMCEECGAPWRPVLDGRCERCGNRTWIYADPPPEAGETAPLSPCCGLPVPTALDPEHGETCDRCLSDRIAVAERST